jgi:Adenylate kinase and related kinases
MNNAEKINFIKKWLGTGSINIFGRAFAGKDTVGKQLSELLNAEFLSSGDIVRAARKNNDAAIKAAAHVSDTGAWMPIDEFKELIAPYLYSEDIDGRALILSMVGRWIGEEVTVMNALEKGKHTTKAVIVLNVTDDEIWKRWELANEADARNIGRADDFDKTAVQARLDEFKDKTLPVIEVYRKMGLVVEIDGQKTREEVFAEVIDRLYDFARSKM